MRRQVLGRIKRESAFVAGMLITALCLGGCAGPERARPSDLDRLTGEPWTGALTYRDYQSGQPTTIRSTLRVKKEDDAWLFEVGYPDEPDHASRDRVELREGGTVMGDEQIVGREVLDDGTVRLTTERSDRDDDRPATIRYEYTIGSRGYRVVKLVRWQGEHAFFERNRYEWNR